MTVYRVVLIEAWNTPEGWVWNDSCTLAHHSMTEETLSNNRKLLAWMRKEGYLSEHSKGKTVVDRSGCEPDMIEFCDKNNREPFLALIEDRD